MKLYPLSLDFYIRPASIVAKELVGKLFVRKYRNQFMIGRIVETEAYMKDDPASHSYRGKTERNASMFRQGGCLYVYFTYGMHYCVNIVTGEKGTGEAVLIRALEPLEGLKLMRKNREAISGKKIRTIEQLLNEPAKVCQGFHIHRSHDGCTLMGASLMITQGTYIVPDRVGHSERIGIRLGSKLKLRFYLKGSPWLSR